MNDSINGGSGNDFVDGGDRRDYINGGSLTQWQSWGGKPGTFAIEDHQANPRLNPMITSGPDYPLTA